MALLLNSSPTPRPYLLGRNSNIRRFSIKLQGDEPTEVPSPKKTSDSLGFGSSVPSPKKKQKGRASIIRRDPIQKPSFASESGPPTEELQKNESAFLLAWLGLGAIILVEGILLAASGFLPEAWDNFFVKYLYPSFTPTVFLFVAGTVAYGVLKYLENEKFNSEN